MRNRSALPLGIVLLLASVMLTAATVTPPPSPTASPGWPGSLRNGLPQELPGYATAPKDPYPDTDENEMGVYTQVSRRYQRIESVTFARSLVVLVQDYGRGKDLTASLRNAMREAGKVAGFTGKEQTVGGRPAFVVFHREGQKPVTVVTVMATPSRVVLGLGDNIDDVETMKLLAHVDLQKIADAK